MKTIHLKINGMHCSSCEKLITMELEEIKGYLSSKINSSAGTGEIQVEDNVLDKQVIDSISQAGYRAQILEG